MGKRALLVVDTQNDFYEDGALPVQNASEINPVINKLMIDYDYDIIIGSQDWHPPDHLSFAVNMGAEPFTPYDNGEGIGPVLWPVHCRQKTEGAEFHPDINTEYFDYILRKGTSPEVDSYSAFQENNGTDLGLAGLLKSLNIKIVDVCGLAYDVCVKHTAIDAASGGFRTRIIKNATRAVNNEGDDIEALETELEEKNVIISEKGEV